MLCGKFKYNRSFKVFEIINDFDYHLKRGEIFQIFQDTSPSDESVVSKVWGTCEGEIIIYAHYVLGIAMKNKAILLRLKLGYVHISRTER